MSNSPAGFYLLVEMISSVLGPGGLPAVGPMEESECRAIKAAVEAERPASVASVSCVQVRVLRACEEPGRPGSGRACPVFDHGPLLGPSKD